MYTINVVGVLFMIYRVPVEPISRILKQLCLRKNGKELLGSPGMNTVATTM